MLHAVQAHQQWPRHPRVGHLTSRLLDPESRVPTPAPHILVPRTPPGVIQIMSHDDGTFLQVLCKHAPYNSLEASQFVLIASAGYAEVKGPKTLRYNTEFYNHVFQCLQFVVPNLAAEDIHCFIKEVLTIIQKKGWTGIHCTTRTTHVTKIWQMVLASCMTSRTRVVCSLWSVGKLYEAVNMVYVYALMDYHTSPQGIYRWAYERLVA